MPTVGDTVIVTTITRMRMRVHDTSCLTSAFNVIVRKIEEFRESGAEDVAGVDSLADDVGDSGDAVGRRQQMPFADDGGPAASVQLSLPRNLASGRLFAADVTPRFTGGVGAGRGGGAGSGGGAEAAALARERVFLR